MNMVERELYLKRAGPILERLKERGIEPPPLPPGDGQEMAACAECGGKGSRTETQKVIAIRPEGRKLVEEKTKIHCSECGGSGFKVRNAFFEWAKTVQGMLNG